MRATGPRNQLPLKLLQVRRNTELVQPSTQVESRVAVIESSKYQTRKGVQVGDDADAVRQQYGKPQNRRLSLNKSRRSIGEMKGLFYKDIFFVMDGENKVIAIILGNTKA